MKKNKMLYRIVAAVLACAVVALALVTYQSRSSSNAPVAEGAVTATGSAKGMEGDVVVEVTADATTIYADDQLGYWNFVYQAGGYILNEDKTKAGFTQPATEKAMKFYIGLQQNDWCPDQTYFAETAPGTAFFSEKGAMFLEGDWNILAELQNYPEMVGKWDVAVLPKCPDPESGDGRATISNGLCYATAASNKNLDTVKDILKFFGSEEGQRIQGESGAAIPAYQGLEDTWAGCFAEYPINIQCFIEMFEYSIQSVNNASRPEWKSKVNDELLKIYAGTEDLETGLQKMQDIVDQASAG